MTRGEEIQRFVAEVMERLSGEGLSRGQTLWLERITKDLAREMGTAIGRALAPPTMVGVRVRAERGGLPQEGIIESIIAGLYVVRLDNGTALPAVAPDGVVVVDMAAFRRRFGGWA